MSNKFSPRFENYGSTVGQQVGQQFIEGDLVNQNYYPASPESQKSVQDLLYELRLNDPRDILASTRRRLGEHTPGTCQWILASAEYLKWRREESSHFLWLAGTPAIGKTMIASVIVEQEEQLTGSQPERILAHFFCDTKDNGSAVAVLRAILWQIVRARETLAWLHIESNYDRREGSAQFERIDNIRRMLKLSMRAFRGEDLIIVVDGLDECDKASRQELSNIFKWLMNVDGPRAIRVLATSREEEDIAEQLQGLGSFIRLVPGGVVNSDLSLYIDRKVTELAMRKQWPRVLTSKVLQALRRNAQGTFLWVSFVVADLNTVPRSANNTIEDRLESFPKSLEDVYERILEGLDDPGARDILQLVAIAQRPLTAAELAVALLCQASLESAPPLISAYNIEISSTRYLCCGSMLWFDEKNKTVHLVHKSAQDYLMSDQIKSLQYGVHKESSHLLMWRICERYLNNSGFQLWWWNRNSMLSVWQDSSIPSFSWLPRSSPSILRQCRPPFYEYAFNNWRKHLNRLDFESYFNGATPVGLPRTLP